VSGSIHHNSATTIRRTLLPILAMLTVFGGMLAAIAPTAFAGAPYSCTTSSANGGCPADGNGYKSYAGTSSFSSVMNSSSPYVDADMWGPVSGETQTINANSPGDWQAVVNIPSGSNPSGGVTTYPDAGMQFNGSPVLSSFGDITSSFADTIPHGSADQGWQGYDNWFNNWGDEVMIQTQYINQFPCPFVAVQQFGGSNGVPVQTWGLCNFGGAGGEKVWQLAQPGVQVGGENDYSVQETSGSVDITAMTDWLIANGYMLTNTPAATTLTGLSAGFEVCQTANGGSTWTYTDLTFVNNTGGGQQQLPLATTNAATGVNSSGATLNGTVNPEGAATNYQFDYGTTTGYGTSVPSGGASAGSGSSAVPETAGLTGLTANTTYHYRIEATNSAGTTFGSDQQFTTSAAGGGGNTVAYDATGPSSSGAKAANASSLSWTHTVGSGSDTALLAEVAVGTSNDNGCVLTVKDGTTAMTPLATVHDNGRHAGYLEVFGLAGPPGGDNAITATVTGCRGGVPLELTGGSESFTGVSQSAPFGTAITAKGSGGTATVATTGSTTGNLIAGFAANGSGINSARSPSVSRYIANQDNNSGAGNSAGATSAATGSAVTMKWSLQNDWWGAAILEVQHS
jgi:hypothetical protein